MLLGLGVTHKDIHQIMVENRRRFLVDIPMVDGLAVLLRPAKKSLSGWQRDYVSGLNLPEPDPRRKVANPIPLRRIVI